MTTLSLPSNRMRTALLAVLACLVPAAWSAPALAGDAACETLKDCPCVLQMVENSLGRGWVGIYMDNDGEGYVVTQVIAGGPAERAGLEAGDRLQALNGVPMTRKHEKDLAGIYETMVPDAEIVYTIERRGETQDVEITLGRLPEKMLSVILGQKLLQQYARTTGKKPEFPEPPRAPKPPPPKEETPSAPAPGSGSGSGGDR